MKNWKTLGAAGILIAIVSAFLGYKSGSVSMSDELDQLAGKNVNASRQIDSLDILIRPFENAIRNKLNYDRGKSLAMEDVAEDYSELLEKCPQEVFSQAPVSSDSDSRYRLSVIQSWGWPMILNVYKDSFSLEYFVIDTSGNKFGDADIRKATRQLDYSTKRQINSKIKAANFWFSSTYQNSHGTLDGYVVIVEGISPFGYNKVFFGNPNEENPIDELINFLVEELKLDADFFL